MWTFFSQFQNIILTVWNDRLKDRLKGPSERKQVSVDKAGE